MLDVSRKHNSLCKTLTCWQSQLLWEDLEDHMFASALFSFEVDIDRGPELQIVEAIARLPHLSALVDEIFFERLGCLY